MGNCIFKEKKHRTTQTIDHNIFNPIIHNPVFTENFKICDECLHYITKILRICTKDKFIYSIKFSVKHFLEDSCIKTMNYVLCDFMQEDCISNITLKMNDRDEYNRIETSNNKIGSIYYSFNFLFK